MYPPAGLPDIPSNNIYHGYYGPTSSVPTRSYDHGQGGNVYGMQGGGFSSIGSANQHAQAMLQQANSFPSHPAQPASTPITKFQSKMFCSHPTPVSTVLGGNVFTNTQVLKPCPPQPIDGNLRVQVTPLMAEIFQYKTNKRVDGYQAPTMVDGGCNMSCSGRNFHVLEFSEAKVDLNFANGDSLEGIPLVSSVTLPLHTDGRPYPYLIGIHNAAHMPTNTFSLLCPHQIREHGIFCCDVNLRHGGHSMILGTDGQHIDLTSQDALLQVTT
jgi:hypothetical protein